MDPPLIRSFIVLGAAEGAGLTAVTSAILRALRAAGVRAVGMKPVARGVVSAGGTWLSPELQSLSAAGSFGLPARALCTQFRRVDEAPDAAPAAAPTLDAVIDTFRVLSTWADAVVVDGAEGTGFSSRVLAQALGLPFVYVVDGEPGVALDEARSLAAAGVPCAGWLLDAGDAARSDCVAAAEGLRAQMPGVWLGMLRRHALRPAESVVDLHDPHGALRALAA